jgi:hypothetical protein
MAALGTMPWLDSGSKIAKQQVYGIGGVYGIAWWHWFGRVQSLRVEKGPFSKTSPSSTRFFDFRQLDQLSIKSVQLSHQLTTLLSYIF